MKSARKFNAASRMAISYRSNATAKPIASVFQMLAAEAVPAILS